MLILFDVSSNLAIVVLCKHSFCLGFANFDSQTNKLHDVQTLHCKWYTVHYVPEIELSRPETSQE